MKQPQELLVLELHETRVTLDPRRGGAIRDLSWRGCDILRPTPAGAGDDPFDTACFPMVPFVNRIAHGRFEFGGRTVQLERNWSEDPHPLHGKGWREPWSTVAESASRATLRLEGGADEWPWRYRCEQHFHLQPDGLSVELSVENLSAEPMPAMLGLHPYFPDAAHAQLRARLPWVWLTDGAALPLQEVLTPPAWGFEPARAIKAVPLDHGFSGWNGIASLRWPDRTVTVTAPASHFLHVFAPADHDYFCVEPQTAPPGALTRGASEAPVVAPGERSSIRVHFGVGAS
jgi:aldose 1-epimerase